MFAGEFLPFVRDCDDDEEDCVGEDVDPVRKLLPNFNSCTPSPSPSRSAMTDESDDMTDDDDYSLYIICPCDESVSRNDIRFTRYSSTRCTSLSLLSLCVCLSPSLMCVLWMMSCR